jgi:hypothetical protein
VLKIDFFLGKSILHQVRQLAMADPPKAPLPYPPTATVSVATKKETPADIQLKKLQAVQKELQNMQYINHKKRESELRADTDRIIKTPAAILQKEYQDKQQQLYIDRKEREGELKADTDSIIKIEAQIAMLTTNHEVLTTQKISCESLVTFLQSAVDTIQKQMFEEREYTRVRVGQLQTTILKLDQSDAQRNVRIKEIEQQVSEVTERQKRQLLDLEKELSAARQAFVVQTKFLQELCEKVNSHQMAINSKRISLAKALSVATDRNNSMEILNASIRHVGKQIYILSDEKLTKMTQDAVDATIRHRNKSKSDGRDHRVVRRSRSRSPDRRVRVRRSRSPL